MALAHTPVAGSPPHLIDAAELCDTLETDPGQGLSSAEVERRLERYGRNELRARGAVPLWRRILAQFQDPLVYLLLVAIVVSLVIWIIEGMAGVPVDVVVIAAILILNAVIGFVQEAKAEDAVAALAEMTAATSSVLRDGRAATVPSADLVPGDVLLLSEGDSVGADARLVEASGLKIQEAALTGESAAVVKSPATLDGEVALADRHNMVHKGTAVVEGVGRAVVTTTGMATEMGHIADLLDRTEQDPSPLQVEIATVSRTLGILVIAIAVVVMVTLAVVQGADTADEWVTILLLGVSLAVAAVPEGLPAILSLVLAIGVRAMARRNAVMKHLHSVETLGSTSVICSDKTGTLTRNEMTLRAIVTASGRVDLTGTGYAPVGEPSFAPSGDGSPTEDPAPDDLVVEARLVLIGGTVANNASIAEVDGQWVVHGDPTEAAFVVATAKLGEVPERIARYERRAEVPFTSERKMMSVLAHHDERAEDRIYTKGAPDVLLERCVSERRGERVVPLDDTARSRVLAQVEHLSGEGYRTLGVAYRIVGDGEQTPGRDDDVEHDLVLAGVVGIIDPPREEARAAVADAHRAGVRTIMITGDHPATAQRIAADLGIVAEGGRAATGLELERLDDAGLAEVVRTTSVYARVAPQHKLRIVDALQSDGQVVAMTGDGVNDAPALKTADIGIAMGITGTEVTKEASRMILADDNFATIVAAIHRGRIIFDNIAKFLRYMMSSNLGEVFTVFFGIVLAGVIGLRDASSPDGLVVPLLATQILWINLVTDSVPGLAMGVDPEIDDVMARRPRRPDRPILDRRMWARILFTGTAMGAVTLATMDLFLPGGLLAAPFGAESFDTARTAGFTTLVLAQLFNALSSRSATQSAFHRMFRNPWLWSAIGLVVALQLAVVHLPFLQAAFTTEPLTFEQWLVCVGMASVVLWAQEVVKLVERWASPEPTPA
ncbi:HAD-IC family P-type ATPase [Nostocoides sp. F2B08]|uniref:cation-translocating P-type ATPase n=1 Tax=Nostocoides sp. F2B08 TaxID=2653936 RepID=UPI00126374CA|nr:cation-translocating P-type ATPase [Tetrasphaera sp. F2B08]KAB7745670.1 HAD-IC family P-type ATPase [Tetrasphaera sp. F2B08]